MKLKRSGKKRRPLTQGRRVLRAPHLRARAALRQALSPRQRRQWARTRRLLLHGNAGGRFRVTYATKNRPSEFKRVILVYLNPRSYRWRTRWFIWGGPRADLMLGLKLQLEARERGFLRELYKGCSSVYARFA